MAHLILPQEFNILADHYVIRTRVPANQIKDEMILLRVHNANLSAGDKITVQCMSHAYDELLHEAEYRVVVRKDALKVREINDRETRQVNEVSFLIARKGDWWASPVAKIDETVIGIPLVVEHKGGGRYAVIDGNGVVLCTIGKDDGGKERAELIAAGSEPIPEAA